MALDIQLLGGLQIRDDQAIVAGLESPRLQALIARLVLYTGVPQPRAQLAFLFWPDTSESQARTNLRKLLHDLRRSLPIADHFLSLDGVALTWRTNAPSRLDVHEFAAAAAAARSALDFHQAASLYRGDLLPSCYDDWLVPERERLRQLFVRLIERALAEREGQGDYDGAIAYAQRWHQHDNLSEAAYCHLMRLHALAGDRTAALRVFDACLLTLQRELGVRPSVATRAIYDQIRTSQLASAPPSMVEPDSAATSVPPVPVVTTPLLGRAAELNAIRTLLHHAAGRLITLTGPGGTGKTRLALALAHDLAGAFADGIAFVALAPITDPELVLPTVAHAFSVKEAPGQPLAAALVERLGEWHGLLVLDNFEQVLPAAASLAQLLADCPHLSVLVTSRAALRLSGEQEYPVPPLPLPDLRHPPTLDSLCQYAAVALFISRAQAVQPDFAVTNVTAPAVAEICHRLDGLPLAIELAAARIRLLTPQAMLARLGRRLALLTGGPRDRPARQRTLRATLDWSYALLDALEQTLFARLAVFVDGWTLPAAAAVCVTGSVAGALTGDLMDQLDGLVSKSLVHRLAGPSKEPRFGMLETIREYAYERLEASGEAPTLRSAHANYCLSLADQAEPHLRGSMHQEWLERLEGEYDNLRATLRWAEETDNADVGLRLAGLLWQFWRIRGHLTEGRAWLERLLTMAPAPTIQRAQALLGVGVLAGDQGEFGPSADRYAASLALYQQLADQPGVALASYYLGNLAVWQGDTGQARVLLEASLELAQRLGDSLTSLGALAGLGDLARNLARYGEARERYAASLTLARANGEEWHTFWLLGELGNVARIQGDFLQADRHLRESLDGFRHLRDGSRVANVLKHLGHLALALGDFRSAQDYYDASLAQSEDIGDRLHSGIVLGDLGNLARRQGQHEEAVQRWRACLTQLRQFEEHNWCVGWAMGNVGAMAIQRRSRPEGVRLIAAAAAAYPDFLLALDPDERDECAAGLQGSRAALGEPDFAAAWLHGQTLRRGEAFDEALDVLGSLDFGGARLLADARPAGTPLG